MEQQPEYPELPAGSIPDFLSQLYAHLPLLVVRLRPDGMVLGANEQVTRTTGYAAADLVGRNWWALLFPGRLFAQVPRFISPATLEGVLRDVPMSCRTKDGRERVIAWTRFLRQDGARRELVCIGLDLTDRLLKADLESVTIDNDNNVISPPALANSETDQANVDTDAIEPLAVVPPPRSDAEERTQSLSEVQESLRAVEESVAALNVTFDVGETATLARLAAEISERAAARGLSHFQEAAEQLHALAERAQLAQAESKMTDLVKTLQKAQHSEPR